jgi:hypothetical protein
MNKMCFLLKTCIFLGFSLPIETFSAQVSRTLTTKDLPQAMQPKHIPSTARSIAPFRPITDRLSMKQIVEIFGLPDRDLGSGIYIYVYNLKDRSQVRIGTPDGKQILYVVHSLENGKQEDIFRKGSPQISFEKTAKGIDRSTCDFLSQWQIKPKELKLASCDLKHSQMDLLIANYTLKGTNAAIVEKFLRGKFRMGKLRYVCCGWETADKNGVYQDKDNYSYAIAMSSGETIERDWPKIKQFHVTITKYLTDP